MSTGAGDMRALILWKGPLPWSPGTQGNLLTDPQAKGSRAATVLGGRGAEGTQPAFDKVMEPMATSCAERVRVPRLLRNCRDKETGLLLQNKETCMFVTEMRGELHYL